jgi:hypothetical protein
MPSCVLCIGVDVTHLIAGPDFAAVREMERLPSTVDAPSRALQIICSRRQAQARLGHRHNRSQQNFRISDTDPTSWSISRSSAVPAPRLHDSLNKRNNLLRDRAAEAVISACGFRNDLALSPVGLRDVRLTDGYHSIIWRARRDSNSRPPGS